MLLSSWNLRKAMVAAQKRFHLGMRLMFQYFRLKTKYQQAHRSLKKELRALLEFNKPRSLRSAKIPVPSLVLLGFCVRAVVLSASDFEGVMGNCSMDQKSAKSSQSTQASCLPQSTLSLFCCCLFPSAF